MKLFNVIIFSMFSLSTAQEGSGVSYEPEYEYEPEEFVPAPRRFQMANDVSMSSTDPVEEEETTVVFEEQVAQETNQVAQVSNQFGQISNQIAQVSNQVAQVTNQVAQVINQVAQVPDQ